MTYIHGCFAYTGSMFWKVVLGLGETHISDKRAPRVGEVHFCFNVNQTKRIRRSLQAVIPTATVTTTTTTTTTTATATATATATTATTTTTTTTQQTQKHHTQQQQPQQQQQQQQQLQRRRQQHQPQQQQQQQQQQKRIRACKDLCVLLSFLRAPFPCLKVDTLFSEWCTRLHEVLLHPLCTETLVKWNALWRETLYNWKSLTKEIRYKGKSVIS